LVPPFGGLGGTPIRRPSFYQRDLLLVQDLLQRVF